MIDNLLTRIIDFIFPHQKDFKNEEKLFWDDYWNKRIRYYEKYGEIFEINNKWDFNGNKALHKHYKSAVGDFNKIKCIECGSGGGYESALMAKDGATISVLDYSRKAIDYSKIVSKRVGVSESMQFICKDIFNFQPNCKYDLSWNCGVIEHYEDEEIIKVIKKMKSLVRDNGLVVITVPNLLSPQSVYWMLSCGKGSEKYLSRKKLKNLMETAGLKDVKIKNLNYWLPSFSPLSWAVKTSKWTRLNNSKISLAWLFSGIGFNSN